MWLEWHCSCQYALATGENTMLFLSLMCSDTVHVLNIKRFQLFWPDRSYSTITCRVVT